MPFTNEPQSHRLHSPGAQTAVKNRTEEWRHSVAHNTVNDPAGDLGIHQIHIHITRVCHPFFEAFRSNLVKENSTGILAGTAHFCGNVPGDGLTLSIRVSGQIDIFNFCRTLFQLLDDLSLSGHDYIFCFEVVGYIYPELFRRKILDMSVGCFNTIFLPEIPLDSPGF